MTVYEKPDPTWYPNVQTQPNPKPEKVEPVATLLKSSFLASLTSDLRGPSFCSKLSTMFVVVDD